MNKIIGIDSKTISKTVAVTLVGTLVGYGSGGYIYTCIQNSKCDQQEHTHVEQHVGSYIGNQDPQVVTTSSGSVWRPNAMNI